MWLAGNPLKSPRKATAAAEKRFADQKKTVRVKHLSGEVQSVNSKAKTIIVRFKDEDVEMKFDGSTIVKVDLDSVKPAEIPLGSRATVKYVRQKDTVSPRGFSYQPKQRKRKKDPRCQPAEILHSPLPCAPTLPFPPGLAVIPLPPVLQTDTSDFMVFVL